MPVPEVAANSMQVPATKATIGEEGWRYSYHAVAFLDLLGQRALFQDVHIVPDSPEQRDKCLKVLTQTVGFIQLFRKGFEDIFNEQRALEIPGAVPVQFHDDYKRTQQTEIYLQSVSDAVIAWSPILINVADEAMLCRTMNSLWGMLFAAAGMTLIALGAKHALRGGIDVDGGITIEPGGSEIYGRALNCAYALESEAAQYPRILIGDGFTRFLDSTSMMRGTSKFSEYSQLMARRCKELITIDADGKPIVHYLGPGAKAVMELSKLAPRPNDFVDPAYAFVKESVEKFRDDKKLGPRYIRLKQYFERHLSIWQS